LQNQFVYIKYRYYIDIGLEILSLIACKKFFVSLKIIQNKPYLI